jgi:hypothetical protein
LKRKISVYTALTAENIRTKAWPKEWKPYLLAWKKAIGKVNAQFTWPWNKEDLSLGNFKASEFSVKKIQNFWRRPRIAVEANSLQTHQPGVSWLFNKPIDNKKRDIFWRLYHRALPLGYRIKHIDTSDNGDCLWCSGEIQTIEHFALKCAASIEIWNTAYSLLKTGQQETPPLTFDEIFNISNIQNKSYTQATEWLHINIIYEIWCCYTTARWGSNIYSIELIPHIVARWLNKEIRVLFKTISNSQKKLKLFKCLKPM